MEQTYGLVVHDCLEPEEYSLQPHQDSWEVRVKGCLQCRDVVLLFRKFLQLLLCRNHRFLLSWCMAMHLDILSDRLFIVFDPAQFSDILGKDMEHSELLIDFIIKVSDMSPFALFPDLSTYKAENDVECVCQLLVIIQISCFTKCSFHVCFCIFVVWISQLISYVRNFQSTQM